MERRLRFENGNGSVAPGGPLCVRLESLDRLRDRPDADEGEVPVDLRLDPARTLSHLEARAQSAALGNRATAVIRVNLGRRDERRRGEVPPR